MFRTVKARLNGDTGSDVEAGTESNRAPSGSPSVGPQGRRRSIGQPGTFLSRMSSYYWSARVEDSPSPSASQGTQPSSLPMKQNPTVCGRPLANIS
jgi:hypothetical protein